MTRWIAGAFAGVLALVGCGETKPPVAKYANDGAQGSAPAAATTTTTTTAANAGKRDDGTTGSVQISDDIRGPCGISARDAYFPYDSAALMSQDIKPLNEIAQCFTTGPLKGRALKLVGHADPRGSSDYNMVLGQSRADTVRRYLTGRGLDRAKSDSTSRGAMDATGTDETTWAKDRRVDVLLDK